MPLIFLIAYPLFAGYFFSKTKNKVEEIPGNIKFLGLISFVFLYSFVLYNNIFLRGYDGAENFYPSFLIIFIVYIITFFVYKSKYTDILDKEDFFENTYFSTKEYIINLIFFGISFLYLLYFILYELFFNLGHIDEFFRFLSRGGYIESFLGLFMFYYVFAGTYGFFDTISRRNRQNFYKKLNEKLKSKEKIQKEKVNEKNI